MGPIESAGTILLMLVACGSCIRFSPQGSGDQGMRDDTGLEDETSSDSDQPDSGGSCDSEHEKDSPSEEGGLVDTGPSWGGPCSDGSWSGWTSPDGLLHVAPDKGEGDGSAEAPYGSIRTALMASQGEQEVKIALWPGDYTQSVQLKQGDDSVSRSLVLSGCGRGETVLCGGRARTPSLAIAGPSFITVRDLSIKTASSTGLAVRDGANASIENVEVDGGKRRGISIVGLTTTVRLEEVYLHDTVSASNGWDARGWGIANWGAVVTMEDVAVDAVHAFGVISQHGALYATGLEVSNVDVGAYGSSGYGVLLRNMRYGEVLDCTIRGTYGAGIYLLDVVRSRVERCTVESVGQSPVGTGEGIMVRQAFRPFPRRGVYSTTLRDNSISNAARMGIAIWGVNALVEGNQTQGCGYRSAVGSIYADPDSDIRGRDLVGELDRDQNPTGAPNNRAHGMQPKGRRLPDWYTP